MKIINVTISLLLALYVFACLFLYVFQSDFLYSPTPESPHAFNIEKFSNDQITINVIVLNPNRHSAVIYFGGNSESVAKTANKYKNLLPKQTLYFVNYRGYGGSTGLPKETSLYADAQYIYDTVASRHKKISVIGRSLGTGVATLLAATRNIHKMVLITPYDSIQNIAKEQYPFFPVTFLLNEKYNSAKRVKSISAKSLIILAELDMLIPLHSSLKLIKKFKPSQLAVETIREANHRNLSHRERYYSLINNFL